MFGFAYLCWYSFNEGNVDLWLRIRNLGLASVRFHILLDGLDPDLAKVKAHTQVEPISPFADQNCNKDLDLAEMTKDVQLLYEVPTVMDRALIYEAIGLRGINQSTDDPKYEEEKPFLTSKKPDPADQELTVTGDPRWFPFDEYWLIATMQAGGYQVRKGKPCRLTTAYDLDLRFPGYVVKQVSGKDLLAWNGDPAIVAKLPAARIEGAFWFQKGLAISIQRPLFIKVLAVFLLLSAVVSLPVVAFRSKPGDYLVNCVAYFLGLWAVRGIITVNAPKSPTVVDYAVLTLYCIQIFIVAGRALWSKNRE